MHWAALNGHVDAVQVACRLRLIHRFSELNVSQELINGDAAVRPKDMQVASSIHETLFRL
jgi:hypothetical protein